MMSTSRILIIGLGSVGVRHLRIARNLFPKADIRTLSNRTDSESLGFANGNFGTITEATKYAPQITVVASPTTSHLGHALEMANTGSHLLIEKPISDTQIGVMGLIEICREKKTSLAVGYNLRFSPSLQVLHKLLSDNLLGGIYSVRCEVGKYLPTWRPDRDYREGISARKDLGGGVLLELSHEIDYLQWLFGDVDWVHSTATNQSKLKIDVEDSVHSILGFKTNVRNQQLVGILSLDFIRHDETRGCTVIGEKGTLVWDGVKGEVRCYLESEGKWVVLFQQEPKKDETYFAEWKNFLDSITRGVEPLVTGTQGLKVLETIEAIRNSAALGRRIDVVEGRYTGENFA